MGGFEALMPRALRAKLSCEFRVVLLDEIPIAGLVKLKGDGFGLENRAIDKIGAVQIKECERIAFSEATLVAYSVATSLPE
jgi:hypothetical protein